MTSPISQGILAAQQNQSPNPGQYWAMYCPGVSNNVNANLNDTNLWPGTQDWCWESYVYIENWYNSPALMVGWGSGGNAGNPAVSNWALTCYGNADPTPVSYILYVLGTQSTTIKTYDYATEVVNKWHHIAMSRSGSTINVFVDGELASQMTGVTTDFTQANIGGDGWWFSGGPVGDRDQTYTWGISAAFRNMRYTVGSSVYANGTTITPPSFYDDIEPITGTVFIWNPQSNTYAGNWAGFGQPWTPDYCPSGIPFTGYSGDTAGNCPDVIPFAGTFTALAPYYTGGYTGTQGTWVNQGTNPNQPKYTTTGPTPIIGASSGDFTASGTNVNITSSDSQLLAGINSGFTLYAWFYVPANITNECKNLISCEVTGGVVINIGRAGQGLDWVSISDYGGTEYAYAPHIWARNQWNLLVISRRNNGYTPPDPSAASDFWAWAGNATQSYAKNLNLVNVAGTSTHEFLQGGNVTIGSKTGSAVSSQMYIGEIQTYDNFNGFINLADNSQIPMQNINTRQAQSQTTFTFQGTNGDTNIQPGGF